MTDAPKPSRAERAALALAKRGHKLAVDQKRHEISVARADLRQAATYGRLGQAVSAVESWSRLDAELQKLEAATKETPDADR